MSPILTYLKEPFNSNQTLNTVLWSLLQLGKCRMDQNPHFYSGKALDLGSLNGQYTTDPLSFDEKLKSSKDTLSLHLLVDADLRLVLQTNDLSFYRNFGNIWSTPGSAECNIVKCWSFQKTRQCYYVAHWVLMPSLRPQWDSWSSRSDRLANICFKTQTCARTSGPPRFQCLGLLSYMLFENGWWIGFHLRG